MDVLSVDISKGYFVASEMVLHHYTSKHYMNSFGFVLIIITCVAPIIIIGVCVRQSLCWLWQW